MSSCAHLVSFVWLVLETDVTQTFKHLSVSPMFPVMVFFHFWQAWQVWQPVHSHWWYLATACGIFSRLRYLGIVSSVQYSRVRLRGQVWLCDFKGWAQAQAARWSEFGSMTLKDEQRSWNLLKILYNNLIKVAPLVFYFSPTETAYYY